jgi:hypothetical protein
VGGLVELLGIKRGTEAEGNAGAEENVVGDGCNTAIVDLDLFFTSVSAGIPLVYSSYLCERDRV